MRTNEEIIDLMDSLKEEKGLSLSELARRVGMAKSALSRYFNKTREFPLNRVDDFAKALGVTPEFILGFEGELDIVPIYNQLTLPRQTKVYNFAEHQLDEQVNEKSVPYLGATAANPTELGYGDPIYGESVTKDVPKNADGALTIRGDSMEPDYIDGDIVFYRYQPDVENGQIAIVEIDGNGVTCKKVIKEDGKIVLRSLNDKYEDREVDPERIRILGKVVK